MRVAPCSGQITLGAVLIIGFGLHNATEGYGIARPLGPVARRGRGWGWQALSAAPRSSSAPSSATWWRFPPWNSSSVRSPAAQFYT
jgi:hypothetical protein